MLMPFYCFLSWNVKDVKDKKHQFYYVVILECDVTWKTFPCIRCNIRASTCALRAHANNIKVEFQTTFLCPGNRLNFFLSYNPKKNSRLRKSRIKSWKKVLRYACRIGKSAYLCIRFREGKTSDNEMMVTKCKWF